MMSDHNRAKSFSHKVRTGCITCKRRRVKCDEAKPSCRRCIRGNHDCSGYAVPQAKIFALDKGTYSPPASLEINISGADGLALSSFIATEIAFGNHEERRSLEHWLLRTSPMLAHYGPMGDFYTVVVPQLARESVSIKHMLICLSLVHENFTSGGRSAIQELSPQMISHYNTAINAIMGENAQKIYAIVFSLIGWTMEMMRNNFSAAKLHLRGSQTMAATYNGEFNKEHVHGVFQSSIMPTLLLAQGLTSVRLTKDTMKRPCQGNNPEYRPPLWTVYNFSSIAGARYALATYLENLGRVSSPFKTYETFGDFKLLLSLWFDDVSKWDQESATSAELTALLLLFLLALALLPSSEVAGFSYSINPSIVDFIVKRSAALLGVYRSSDSPTVELYGTLSTVLHYVMFFFPEDESYEQAKSMLRQMNPGISVT